MKINNFVPDSKIFDSIKFKDDLENEENVSFLDTLKEKLNEVNEKQIKAEDLTESFIKGEDVDIHDVMLQTEEAKMSLELAVQVRNKIVEAYQEITRMQL
ncbi:flagellar hook-basal body complex protein FliE [Clostridium sp. USBA 49]|jgi:flagellar hook-basal body complex protein FliE|uniref:flagellar hook-basal body complex protein FliE n=1 Tax=Clostridium TaxID=1485 RepID=UPI00099B1229|nr:MULTISPECIES: flagellar hook-basal body complex protein FliE [Clostridium]SKA72694.1 flagellar hook-basal body complex protein FliE [Clostridium sp. USBA 49]